MAIQETTGNAILRWGWTISTFLAISYLICIGFGLLMPDALRMWTAWAPLLPGFEWLTWTAFLSGLISAFAYGWYIALIGVPLYRFFAKRYPA